MGVINNNRIHKNQKITKKLGHNNKTQFNKLNLNKPSSEVFCGFRSLFIKSCLFLFLMSSLIINIFSTSSKAMAASSTKEVISGDKEKLNQTVAAISSYTPIVKDMKNDLPATKETIFIEKPEIIQTKTRAEIEEEKKNEEIKKALEKERTVIARDRQITTSQTEIYTEQIPTITFNNTNSYSYGFCTWYAASRRSDIPSNWGNANTWFYSALNAGRETGTEPKLGAIIVTYESWYGHVGYVENVDGNKITISEMNFVGWGMVNYRSLDRSNPIIQGYIY
jgi:surface antigen